MNKLKKRKHLARQIDDDATPFIPHNFREELIVKGGRPMILLTPSVYQDMCQLVELIKNEIGWLGTVERTGNHFLIKEIFLFDQMVDYAANIISADALIKWADKLTDERPDGIDIINSIRFWGHSHVDMTTSPSVRDDDQMGIFAKSCDDFFVRGIANRLGCLEFTLYLFKENVEIRDCAWSIQMPETSSDRKNYWQKAIKEKVKETKLSVCRPKTFTLNELQDIFPEFNEAYEEIIARRSAKNGPKKHRR